MQQLNPSEISDIIRQRIDQLDVGSEARNEGTVVSVTDGIIRIHGLEDVMYGEMIEFDDERGVGEQGLRRPTPQQPNNRGDRKHGTVRRRRSWLRAAGRAHAGRG